MTALGGDGNVAARLDAVERALATIAAAMTRQRPEAVSVEVEEEVRTNQTRDEAWECQSCRARLALYDVESDLLRIRYKDLHVHVRAGAGGLVRVVCRACGEINQIEHVEQRDVPPQAETRPTDRRRR